MLKSMRNQRGDTIVEVLVAIAVVSLVLTAAYVTVTHNTRTTQDTQEHAQALQLAQTQVEYLRGADAAHMPVTNGCFNDSGNPVTSGNCVLKSDGTVAGAGVQPAFKVSVAGTGSSPTTYTVLVTWNSLANPGSSNKVTLYYQR